MRAALNTTIDYPYQNKKYHTKETYMSTKIYDAYIMKNPNIHSLNKFTAVLRDEIFFLFLKTILLLSNN